MSQSVVDVLTETAGRRVSRLQISLVGGRGDTEPWPGALGAMARLRRADAAEVGDDPDLWALTLADLPQELTGRTDEPTRAERALHASLVLYAVHQQSQQRPMHVRGISLGLAAGRLARVKSAGEGLDAAVLRRFHTVATSSGLRPTLYHLRSLVTLLRSEEISLDYGRLAADIFRLQSARTAPGVRLRWGRDVHSRRDLEPTGSASIDGEP